MNLLTFSWIIPLGYSLAQSPVADQPWNEPESVYLKNVKQLTRDFARAGESYFSPDGEKLIFQAEELPKGDGANPFYQIYTLDLGTGATRRVSPGVGKTTCAFFHPTGKKVIFASTHLDPKAKDKYAPEITARAEEKAKGIRRRYQWDFDGNMDIFEANPDGTELKRLTETPGYDAEGSYSPDGKQIVFCSNRSGAENLELFIMDSDGKNVRQLTKAPGCYNGGPLREGPTMTFTGWMWKPVKKHELPTPLGLMFCLCSARMARKWFGLLTVMVANPARSGWQTSSNQRNR